MRLRRERVPESHIEVDLSGRDHLGDLSIAALRSAQQKLDAKAGVASDQLTGVLGRVELRSREQIAIPSRPLEHFDLGRVVSDQRGAERCSHASMVRLWASGLGAARCRYGDDSVKSR